MTTIDDILFFDCETTGKIPRGAKWDADFADFPYIVQLSWMKGKKIESHIIRPDGWTIPDDVVEIHGITTEIAMRDGEPFADIVWRFIVDCIGAELICGHNIHFDTSVVKANILRQFGWGYYDENGVEDALYKGKRIDTMMTTIKWVDARFADGRVKFPRLEELYSRCFPGETFPAHDALEDVKAVARCLPVLVENGLVALKIKEYPDDDLFKSGPSAGSSAGPSAKQVPNDPASAFARIAKTADACSKIAVAVADLKKAAQTAKNGTNSHDNPEVDNLPIKTEKCGQIAFFDKITEYDVELNFFS